MKKATRWGLRSIILVTLIGIICGVIYTYVVNIIYNFVKVAATPAGLGPVVDNAFAGLWFIAAPLCMYFVPKVGAGILGETLAAVVEMFLGGQWGAMTLLYGIVQGAGNEFGFFPHQKNYVRFSWSSCLWGAFGASVAAFIYNYLVYGYSQFKPGMLLLLFVVSTASALLFDGVMVKLITLRFDAVFAVKNANVAN